ncbi:MAG: hypothetical protein A3A94_03310 [Candidatus Portnoybacteria bacterium RIFCSPLOWO2_01_FULL_43_11]|uniref:Uncharacterized protein n=1 Tax=Candidatus Portnoybacteria bacterium RIFCSPLOWO2_01_FULL_43_11 TaxID=1802000 RepID=A0A1G2FMS5_9BACT|nr:MAG: hypothetical protein A3A94_03310 [Candidatus Portnoybacteria bacterium RIFCSPLOWO2_01_FULL_43_11]
MNQSVFIKSIINGLIGLTVLLAIYFTVISLISGWSFALSQFSDFWYFIISLALGFGVQIGLYAYLRNVIKIKSGSGKVVAVSGATSTVAMVSCCAHYFVNLLPIIGVSGIFVLIGQYQIELFWLGIIANLFGISYIASRIIKQ